MEGRQQLTGSVERITYYNEESGYTVLRLKPDSRDALPYAHGKYADQLITVVGNLPALNPGEWLKLTGQWLTHPKHGRQFQVEQCEQSSPATVEGIKRYLGSGMVRGVGKVMAERIVNRFGAETLDVIDEQPERLREVLGIGQKRVDSVIKAWQEQRAIKDVMVFLHSHGISTHLAVKIYKQYGDQSLGVVQATPYRLVQDIHGIGFKTADKIAQALGLPFDAPARVAAGIHLQAVAALHLGMVEAVIRGEFCRNCWENAGPHDPSPSDISLIYQDLHHARLLAIFPGLRPTAPRHQRSGHSASQPGRYPGHSRQPGKWIGDSPGRPQRATG